MMVPKIIAKDGSIAIDLYKVISQSPVNKNSKAKVEDYFTTQLNNKHNIIN